MLCFAFTLSRSAFLAVVGYLVSFLPDLGLTRPAVGEQSAAKPPGLAGPGEPYRLNDGNLMPKIGMGTYRISPGNDTYASVAYALKIGYRMIDTAYIYGNGEDVGRAIRDSGIPRNEVFVTTKLWMDKHGYDSAIRAGTELNDGLDVEYIDLLLIHTPAGGKIVETYDGILALKAQGVVRSVGVSNFGVPHLLAIAEYCRPPPAVNQIELHPLIYKDRRELVEYCRRSGILVQSYGSLLSGEEDLLRLARGIAAKRNKSEAQVMLRWAVDQGFQVIPKSVNQARLRDNFNIFDFSLTQEELLALSSLPGKLDMYWNPLTSLVDVGNVGPRPTSCRT